MEVVNIVTWVYRSRCGSCALIPKSKISALCKQQLSGLEALWRNSICSLGFASLQSDLWRGLRGSQVFCHQYLTWVNSVFGFGCFPNPCGFGRKGVSNLPCEAQWSFWDPRAGKAEKSSVPSLFQLPICGMLFNYWCVKIYIERKAWAFKSLWILQAPYRLPTEDIKSVHSKFKTADTLVFLNYFSRNLFKSNSGASESCGLEIGNHWLRQFHHKVGETTLSFLEIVLLWSSTKTKALFKLKIPYPQASPWND